MTDEASGSTREWVIDGGRVSKLLKQRGLSQAEFARRLGVSAQHVGRLLRKRTDSRYGTVQKMAQVLGVTPQDLTPTGRPLEVFADGERGVQDPASGGGVEGFRRPELTRVELWGAVPATRGSLRFKGVIELPAAWLNGIERPVVVELLDDAMAPTAPRGSMVIADATRSWSEGRFHLIGYGEQEVARRISVRENLLYWVEPDGTEMLVPKREVRLIGVVVRWFNWGDAP